MARLSTGLVWAVLLRFVVLGIRVSPGNGVLLGNLASLPPVRIICKQNTKLSMAIRDNTVVLATTNFSDASQLWVQDYYSIGKLAADDGCRKPFALVNIGTRQAIVITNTEPVKLAQYNPVACVPLSTLWTEGMPVRDNYYQIKVFRDESFAFNGLGGNVHDGTVIGSYPAGPTIGDNTLFQIVGFLSFP